MAQFMFQANKPYQKYHKIDMGLVVSILLLWGLGIFTLFVCSQNYAMRAFNDSLYFVKRQIICSLGGFIFMMAFVLLDQNKIKKLLSILVFASIGLCVLTFIPGIGIEKNGARRWIRMPLGFSFQPSELLKLSLVLYLSNYFEKQSLIENEEEKTVFPSVVFYFVFVCVVLAQKDFSTSVFIALIGILMFFVSGNKLRWIWPALLIIIPGVILLVTLEPYRLNRIIGFIRPDEMSTGINYQSLAAKRAISAGGFWGSGIGAGLNRINSIPEIQADYIFAGWSESMGFVGVIVYYILLCFFAVKGYITAYKCPTRFAAYGTFGCVSVIFIQSLVNTMVVCGLLPSTGIPLPFFSLGGSSIIVTLGMCGFILNASRCEENSEHAEKYEEIHLDNLTYLK